MRSLYIVAATLVGLPLAAQTPAIAPARSVLFLPAATVPLARTQPGDPAFHQDARTVGAGLGIVTGAVVVFGLSQVVHQGTCDTGPGGGGCTELWRPGFGGYLAGAALGGITGYLIGAALSPRAPAR